MEHVTPELIIAVAVQRLIGSRADLDTAQNAVMQAGNALVNAATDLLEATNPPESALDASAAATARETDGVPEPASKPWGELNIIFDSPPGHDGGQFIEVEDANGRSVCAGEWIKRPDGLCALRILSPAPALLSACQEADWVLSHATTIGEYEGRATSVILQLRAAIAQAEPTVRDRQGDDLFGK